MKDFQYKVFWLKMAIIVLMGLAVLLLTVFEVALAIWELVVWWIEEQFAL